MLLPAQLLQGSEVCSIKFANKMIHLFLVHRIVLQIGSVHRKMKIEHGICHALFTRTVKYKVRHLHSTMWTKFCTICTSVFDERSMSKSNPNQISSVIIISQSSLLHKLQKWKPKTIFFSRRIRYGLIFEYTIIFPLPSIPFTAILSALLQIFQ